jgi:hypothetical protein
LTPADRFSERYYEVRVIVTWIQNARPEIHDLKAVVPEIPQQLGLQSETAVIARDANTHRTSSIFK